MLKSIRYIWPLFICQSLAFSSVTQMVFSGTIVGRELGPSAWATLPMALLPIGTAVGVLPFTRLMASLGRRRVLIFALLMLAASNVLASVGVSLQSFIMFCCASFLVGVSLAALSQLRFAAMEIVSDDLKAGAANLVLLGGIVAAFVGPELGLAARTWHEQSFVGSYLIMAIVSLCGAIFVFPVQGRIVAEELVGQKVPALSLIQRPPFILALSAGAVAYGLMSYVMTATPISMHDHFQHSLKDSKWVIQSHIAAMFLPSLFNAWLVNFLGFRKMMALGLVAFGGALVIAAFDQSLMSFWLALVCLGLGWNFLYMAGTVMLPSTHSEQEKFSAQGLNDFLVFSVQAFVSFMAGVMLSNLGWVWMLFCCFPLLLWHLLLLLRVR